MPWPRRQRTRTTITRWDARTLKVTLRHGDIKNLGMPPMSVVFRVQDTSVVGTLKPGDKVQFRAEQVDGCLHRDAARSSAVMPARAACKRAACKRAVRPP